MQTVILSDETANNLRQLAALRGLDANACAEELLSISLAVLRQNLISPERSHRAMEFSAIAPTSRTVEEIDADIEANRAEWKDAANLLSETTGTP